LEQRKHKYLYLMLSRDKILRSENKLSYFLCRDGVTYLKLQKIFEL